jgi:prophage tail gpP-like protein
VKRLEFIYRSPTDGFHPLVGQRVIVRMDSVAIFKGTVDRIAERKVAGSDVMHFHIEAVDQSIMFERRLITFDRSYIDETAGFIVRDIVATFLTGEDISVNSVSDGPTLPDTVTVEKYKSLSEAMDQIAELADMVWFLTPSGNLAFYPRADRVSPFTIGEATGCPPAPNVHPLEGTVRVRETREKYRNRQTVIYNEGEDEVTVNDTAEQAARAAVEGGTGIYHAVEEAEDIETLDEATNLADALLRRYAVISSAVDFAIRTSGLKPGQTVTITLPAHNIAAEFLIDKVTMQDEGEPVAKRLRWGISCLSEEHLNTTGEFWRRLAR